MTTNNKLEFPDFLFGSFLSLHRRILKESEKWAKSYLEGNSFPSPLMREVPAHSVIYMSDVTDINRHLPQWRLYFVGRLCDAILQELNWENHRNISDAFEKHVLNTPWGALDTAISHIPPNSIEKVTARILALLNFWESLDSLYFVGRGTTSLMSLSNLVKIYYAGFFNTWLDNSKGSVKQDLIAAMDTMNEATEEERRKRLVTALCALALKEASLKENPRLNNPSWINAKLEQLPADVLDDISTGHTPRVLNVLYDLSKILP